LINSLGNIDGFIGPWLMGWFKQLTDHYGAGLTTVAGILLIGAVLAFAMRAGPESESRSDV
jgi:MFS transporter, ACS family, tartrate transporter